MAQLFGPEAPHAHSPEPSRAMLLHRRSYLPSEPPRRRRPILPSWLRHIPHPILIVHDHSQSASDHRVALPSSERVPTLVRFTSFVATPFRCSASHLLLLGRHVVDLRSSR
jgi:hypothetical protein